MKRLSPILVTLMLVAPVATAQQPLPAVPQTLGLEEAIDLALEYSPTYRQSANDRGPAAWGVRNAFAQTFLPEFNASGTVSYSGPGSQRFLTSEFVQQSGTVGSFYSLGLGWQLSGRTLSQPGQARASLAAADAAITGSRMNLRSDIVRSYLAVLQAQDQAVLAEATLRRGEEQLRLAQARYQVGQTTVLDVRQAEVARGQGEVGVLQAQQNVTVAKLRLFQTIGLKAPDDLSLVTLSDTFPITEPTWSLPAILAEAEQHNPSLNALKAQESSAKWNARAERSAWLPTFSFSAGWSGFTQQFTNLNPLIQNAWSAAAVQANEINTECTYVNANLVNQGGTLLPCPGPTLSASDSANLEQGVRGRNPSVFPFNFTQSPFSARVTISLPIFTQFSRPLAVSQAGAQAEDAREAVRAGNLQLRADVSQAYYTLVTTYRTIGIQATNRIAAQEQLRLATERYRVGSGTFFDMLTGQVTAQQAEADYIRAIYDYHQAIATLEAAVGRRLR